MLRTKGRNILHVEDDPVDRMAFQRRIMEVWPDCQITSADGRESALALLSNRRFDAVVADYLLGDGTALDIFPDLGDMPIVITTGKGGESVAVRTFRAGAFDYLIKDLEGTYLEDIAGVLERAIAAREGRHGTAPADFPRAREFREPVLPGPDPLRSAIEEHAFVLTFDSTGRITYVNDRMCALTGYRREELLGQDGRMFRSDRHPESFYQSLWSTISQGRIWTGETCNRAKDGSEFWMDTTIVPCFDPAGTITEYVTIRTDVTPRKLENLELSKAKEAAEASNRSKARFLADMSHEIRTPLNGILGTAELLGELQMHPEQRGMLETIQSCSDALLTLVNNVLDYSKIDADRMVLERIPFSLASLMKCITDLFAGAAKAKGLDFGIRAAPDLPRTIAGDPGRIRQILFNLIGNALKFTDKGGVWVDFQCQRMGERGGLLLIAVTDTGIGIPPEKAATLFAEYTQADASTSRKYGGTGLGLAISKKLAGLMGGSLSLESREGTGSTFLLELKYARSETEGGMPGPAAGLAHARILRLESGRPESCHIGERLEAAFMRCQSAATLEAAAEELRLARDTGDPFDFALLEADIPLADLESWCGRIRKTGAATGVRLAVIAYPGMRGDMARYREAGFSVYLTRPVSAEQVLEALALARAGAAGASLITRHSLREACLGEGEPGSLPASAPELRFSRPYRILVADDNQVNRMIAVAMVRGFGCESDQAENGARAVEMARAARYDLILMDCQMPELDGRDAAMRIRELEGGACRVPIIALTANAMQGDREACLAAGMDGYLFKPFRKDALFKALAEFLPVS